MVEEEGRVRPVTFSPICVYFLGIGLRMGILFMQSLLPATQALKKPPQLIQFCYIGCSDRTKSEARRSYLNNMQYMFLFLCPGERGEEVGNGGRC